MKTPGANPLFWIGQILIWALLTIRWTVVDDLAIGIVMTGAAALLALTLLGWVVIAYVQQRKAARG